jgi:TfoX/Sxy family transcriptional regulator of competence genes
MAYDEDLANRIRELILLEEGVSEQRMFGGLAFLINGNMSVTASGRGGLLLRVARGDTEKLLRLAHTRPFEMRGRAMEGWLRIDAAGLATKRQLERWVARSVAHARTLPRKR